MPKKKKIAKWRKSVNALKRVKTKKTRFQTKIVNEISQMGDFLRLRSFVKIYDNKVKKFIKGDWEFDHALAVLGHLLENPAAAFRFGYEKASRRK